MSELYSIFGWGSPLGTGAFLVLLGAFIYMVSRAGKISKK